MTRNNSTAALLVATFAVVSACAPGGRSRDVTTSTPDRPSAVAQKASSPAPVPNVRGSTDGPGFGPGVGAEVDTGIGLQPSMGMLPDVE